jgi:threonyl-tRNA synthetase
MRILLLHANSISYEGVKKAFGGAEETDALTGDVGECLAVYMAVEERDEADPASVAERCIDEITNVTDQVNVDTVVLYPYVHLTSDPSSPDTAKNVLDLVEEGLDAFTVHRSPFGWYKAFTIDVKGHPLAELSREFGPKKKTDGSDATFDWHDEELEDSARIKLTTSLVIGRAVQELFPEAELGSMGLYHDQSYIDVEGVNLSSDHLPQIRKRVKELIRDDLPITETQKINGTYQEEIAEDIGRAVAGKLKETTVVPQYPDAFLKSTDAIGAFDILHLSSAYWRGNSENEQLSRIYSVGFASEDELDAFKKQREEAERRSHVNIGRKQDLFFTDDLSPGSPFFLPNGTTVLNEMKSFLRDKYFEYGYEEVHTPNVFSNELWKTSGHWQHYKDDMFFIEDEDMALKPMNCPSHCVIYDRDVHSYRELPIRLADFGALHRNELSGTLHGLTRVRRFQQDDAHVFCMDDQVEDEILDLIEFLEEVYETFGLEDISVELSTRPEQSMGSDEQWEFAQEGLTNALDKAGYSYEVNEGDGAFYGPKIDFQVTDSLDRSWQLGTIQLDFQMPEKFDLSYEGSDGQPHKPVMIHRALLGSVERFLGILIEHTEGNFPTWLNPVQVQVVTIADRHNDFAQSIVEALRSEGVRAELDDRMESVGKKIRDAQEEKASYMLTVGDDEVEDETVAVRTRDGDVEHGVDVDAFVASVVDEIERRA